MVSLVRKFNSILTEKDILNAYKNGNSISVTAILQDEEIDMVHCLNLPEESFKNLSSLVMKDGFYLEGGYVKLRKDTMVVCDGYLSEVGCFEVYPFKDMKDVQVLIGIDEDYNGYSYCEVREV